MKSIILALLLCLPIIGRSAVLADYRWGSNGDVLDYSGNGRNATLAGAGPTYATSPIPLSNTSLTSFTSSNYITAPVAIGAALGTVGTIYFEIFVPGNDAMAASAAVIFVYQENGQYFRYGLSNLFGNDVMFWPAGVAGEQIVNIGASGKKGRWLGYFFTYDTTDTKVLVYDFATQNLATIMSKTAAEYATPVFSTASAISFGSNMGNGGLEYLNTLGRVVFLNTKSTGISDIPAISEYKQTRLFALFGNSIAYGGLGTDEDDPPTTDGWRKGFRDRAAALGRPWFFAQGDVRGTIEAPYTLGVTGDTTTDTLADLNSRLEATFPNDSEFNNILLGPSMLCNDPYYSLTTISTTTNVDAMIATITARKPLTKIWLSTDVSSNPGSGDTVIPFNTALRDCYTVAKAAGKNVYLLDPGYGTPYPSRVPAHNLCDTDTLHPAGSGEITLGAYVANTVDAELYPTPTVTAVPTATVSDWRKDRKLKPDLLLRNK